MNFHAYIIFESITYDVHSSTVLLFFQIGGKNSRSYINGIATEIGHIFLKCVFTQNYMWLTACLPIRTINSHTCTESSNILSKFAAFNKCKITRASYIDQA